MIKRNTSLILILAVVLALVLTPVPAQASGGYQDVPETSWAVSVIQSASEQGLMNGTAPGVFGYGHTISRAQFVTVLARMRHWDLSEEDPGFSDTNHHWAAPYLAAAVRENTIDPGGAFRPDAPISREEMAVMLVRALGYQDLAKTAEGYSLPFRDVSSNRGYITIAYDIGMTKGVDAHRFAPQSSATREQAAAMLVRIQDKCTAKTKWLHGFYAISSYAQIDLTKTMQAVSLGWSRMTYDPAAGPVLNTERTNGNVYAIPSGYADAVKTMQSNGCALNLSVFMDNQDKALAAMLRDPAARTKAVQAIVTEATRSYADLGASPYSGVTIDFEGLAGKENRANLTAFLTQLDEALSQAGRTLTAAVMPASADGSYYDGYDYRAIGDLADRVILMAHDYQPSTLDGFLGTTYYKTAALTPFPSVYYSLRAATDPQTGVRNPEKLALAISCTANAWQTDAQGRLTQPRPSFPSMATVHQRLTHGAKRGWSESYHNPYLTYTTEEGQSIFLWYENSRSVQDKVQLAKLFGITSVSLWRLGNLPNDPTPGLDFDILPACS